jgi:dienelactone hydrolase
LRLGDAGKGAKSGVRCDEIMRRGRLLFGAVLLWHGAALLHSESVGAPQGPEETPNRRQLWLIPSSERGVEMRALVFRPPGEGPFPLVVINHGTVQSAARRIDLRAPAFTAAAEWFVGRGYAVVVPQRLGHGETGGPYLESHGACADPDYRQAGLGGARSIEAVVAHMTAQPFVRKTGVILLGQSAGSWGALAMASRNPPTVRAVINFAGGRGGRAQDRPNNNCAAERLIATAGIFGKTARIPTLWIYTENDSYFAPAISKRMADAYRAAGGRVEFHLLPAFGGDGHWLLVASEGIPIWGPIVEKFLAGLK